MGSVREKTTAPQIKRTLGYSRGARERLCFAQTEERGRSMDYVYRKLERRRKR